MENSNQFFNDGFSYHKKDVQRNTVRYRCIHFRSKKTPCKALLYRNNKTGRISTSSTQHTCIMRTPVQVLDIRPEMECMARKFAEADLGKSASDIYEAVVAKVQEKHGKLQPLIRTSRRRLMRIIYNTRSNSRLTLENLLAIHDDKHANVSDTDTRKFLHIDTFTRFQMQ